MAIQEPYFELSTLYTRSTSNPGWTENPVDWSSTSWLFGSGLAKEGLEIEKYRVLQRIAGRNFFIKLRGIINSKKIITSYKFFKWFGGEEDLEMKC
tara:strand:- start:255 stop:542 length:288 start_codon:yes stop_codon:yes gene_type:complete